jgi:transmembrane sensor
MDVDPNRPAALTAAGWYARLRASDCTAEDRAAFEAWHAQPGNAARFAAVEQLAAGVDRALASGPRLYPQVLRAVAPATPEPSPSGTVASRWRTLLPRLAAGAVLLLGAVAWIATHLSRSETPVDLLANDSTREQRHRLDDGSVVWLDVGSEVAVRFGGRERAVELRAGRALFNVAHDGARRFTVTAGGSRTVALGTRFQVERLPGEVRVTLADGALAITGAGPAGRSWEARLAPGEQLRWTGAGSTASKHLVDVLRATSWSSGRLVFRDTPLEQAVAELNRYTERKVRIDDPSLVGLTVGGSYLAGNVDQVAAALEAVLPLRADRGDGGEIILRRR